MRKLQAEKGGTTRHLTQFHYTGWPDHDIPTDFDVVLEMIAQMRKIKAADYNRAPMVVHCRYLCTIGIYKCPWSYKRPLLIFQLTVLSTPSAEGVLKTVILENILTYMNGFNLSIITEMLKSYDKQSMPPDKSV